MKRAERTLLLIAGLALAGCAAGAREVKLRAIPDPAEKLSGGDALAVARSQLMLGNVGLALEAFRKAGRDRPNDPAVLAGIGDCYAAMGRFDLAEDNYERALAVAPKDRTYLFGLAAIYEREGKADRAREVRGEADDARRDAMAAAPPQNAATAVPVTLPTDVVISLINEDLAPRAGSITVALPPARVAGPNESKPRSRPVEPQPSPQLVAKDFSEAEEPQIGSITVKLPPARPAARLERLSLAEVALITTGKPVWQAAPGVKAAALPRWIALNSSPPRANMAVLNAARSPGLAASARAILVDRGWRRIVIADAPAARQSSMVLYPRKRAALGRSLAAQFGLRAEMVEGDQLVLVLGFDAIGPIQKQRRS